MIKKIICGVVSLVLLGLFVFVNNYSIAQEETGSSSVTISGKVYCRNCRGGQQIKISARASMGRDASDIASVEIPGPGEYSLKIPKNAGDVYLIAAILLPQGKSSARDGATLGTHDGGVKVKESDITGVDITIAGYKPATMATYKGPTVNIYGKIIYPEFKEGQQIMISVKSSSRPGPPDIAVLNLPSPGDYSLRVPQNAGDVYIQAIIMWPDQRIFSKNNVTLRYRMNPLRIEDRNIMGVDIAR
ncbi:MAG: hypothetical protein PHW54_05960 [Candidatus Omnitrophica bacterium]|nr:hypothetical protein [Candidatus Omnitrophota bacterium]